MAVYAHVALQKLHILPSVFLGLDEKERAFIVASINKRAEKERKDVEEVRAKLE